MQYINKKENADKGYQVVDTLLEDAWNEDEQKYLGFDKGGRKSYYNGLGNINYLDDDGIVKKYSDKIMQLCLQEQVYFCCYCMKQINADSANLEHIIPQNPPESEFQKYMIISDFVDNIIHKKEFDTQIKVQNLDKYPHDIAYHNLIASCESTIHCNKKRGNNYIEPIMYYNDIADRVWYEKNGSIGSDDFLDFLDILGLNNDNLKNIRRLWQLFSKKFETLPNMTTATQQDLVDMVYDAIATDDDLILLLELFDGSENQLSKVFRQYVWFFDYYKK